MEINITEKQLKRLQQAADITEIQMLMANYVKYMSKMDAVGAYEKNFATNDPEVSIELAESGRYIGPEHTKSFMEAYDRYLQDPSDKRGWMELEHLCNPTVIISQDGKRAQGYWTILAPSSKWAMPNPCDQERLTAYWGCGKYFVIFVRTNTGWKIQQLKMVMFLRSPFEFGWMKQADCIHMPVLPDITPDEEPDYYNVYNADYSCASGGIEWGPYLSEDF